MTEGERGPMMLFISVFRTRRGAAVTLLSGDGWRDDTDCDGLDDRRSASTPPIVELAFLPRYERRRARHASPVEPRRSRPPGVTNAVRSRRPDDSASLLCVA